MLVGQGHQHEPRSDDAAGEEEGKESLEDEAGNWNRQLQEVDSRRLGRLANVENVLLAKSVLEGDGG